MFVAEAISPSRDFKQVGTEQDNTMKQQRVMKRICQPSQYRLAAPERNASVEILKRKYWGEEKRPGED